MKSSVRTKRKIDALIYIRQDNQARKISIIHLNKAAEKLTGYLSSEVAGKNFRGLLAPRVKELMDSYIEFDNISNDFASVVRKIPNFQLRSRSGEIVPVGIKVFNLVGRGEAIQEYELLISNNALIQKIEELKLAVKSNNLQIEERDKNTDLPGISSIVYAVETAHDFITQNSDIEVSFALIEIGNISYYGETYGEHTAFEMIAALGRAVKQCCRDGDIVGYMGSGVIGVVLIECDVQSAVIVINRIREAIQAAKITMQSGQQFVFQLVMSYTQITKERSMVQMIDDCEAGLNTVLQNGGEGVERV